MIVLIVVLCVLVLLLLGLLLIRIIIELNTDLAVYRVRIGWLVECTAIPTEEDIRFRVRLPFWQRETTLMRLLLSKSKAEDKEEPERVQQAGKTGRKGKTNKKKNDLKYIRKGVRILKAFRAKRFLIDLDTDNVITNAYLYPVFYFLGRWRGTWRINYQGITRVDIRLQSRVGVILYNLLR